MLAELGCDRVFVQDGLGGFEIPTAVCWKFDYKGLPQNEYFRGPKGFIPVHERFVVFEGSRYELIRNASELRARFAPVTSVSEALSYAVAATGMQPAHGLRVDSKLRYHVKTLEDTFVAPEGDAFVVHNLKEYVWHGCGPHPTFLVSVRIGRDGSVKELSRVRAFEDPAEDRLCVD